MCVAYMYFSIPQPCTLYAYLSHPIGVSLEPSFPNPPPYVMHKYTRVCAELKVAKLIKGIVEAIYYCHRSVRTDRDIETET